MSFEPAHGATPRSDEILKELLRNLSFDFVSTLNRRDVEAALDYFGAEAVMLPPGLSATCGKNSIRGTLEKWFENGPLAVALIRHSVAHWGGLAVEVGTYLMRGVQANSGKSEDKGKYITAWRRQPDGKFLITATIWTRDS